MSRALVTGASGFVGANLVRRLVADGHEVHVLLRPEHAGWRLVGMLDHIRTHEVDLEHSDRVNQIVSSIRPDWVFHLAAYGAYSSQKSFKQMVQTNVLGCASLLDACVETGCDAFVNCGSSSEYGLKDHAPVEDELLEPNSYYAVTKAAATHYCNLAARVHEIRSFTLRLYSIYGPYEEPSRLIPTLLLHALRGQLPPLVSPRTARDYVYVEDACHAIIAVASSPGLASGVYNVCTGVQTTLEELVAVTKNMLDVHREPQWGTMSQRSWDSDVWVGSPAKLQKEIRWQARTDLGSGLHRTVEWFRTNPEWERFYSDQIFPPPGCSQDKP